MLVVAVGFPLFLRSIIEVGFSIAYGLEDRSLSGSGAVAETFFYYFCTVAVYAGVVFVGARFAKDLPSTEATVTPAMMVNEDPGVWKQGVANVQQQPQYNSQCGGTTPNPVPNGNTGPPHGYYGPP